MSSKTHDLKTTGKLPHAHSLNEAVNSDNTLQGYAAMNDPHAHSEIAQVAAGEHFDETHAISMRAYELYQQRSGQDGSPEDDWYQAEQEIRTRRSGR